MKKANVHVMAATAAQPHSQLANVASPPWSEVDAEFAAMISPLHSLLSSNSISTSEAAESFVAILHSYLTRRNIIKNATGNFRHGPHRERGIIALTRRLAKVKNAVRSETGVSKPFLAAVRAHNHISTTCTRTSQRSYPSSNGSQIRSLSREEYSRVTPFPPLYFFYASTPFSN